MNSPDSKPVVQLLGDFEEMSGQFLFFEMDEDLVDALHRNSSPPHRHAYHEIIWVRHGSAVHLLDGEILEFPKQTLLLVPKGRIHRFNPASGSQGSVIRFQEEFLLNPSHLLFSQFIGHTALQLGSEQSGFVESYCKLLSREYTQADPYNLQALRYLLGAFIAKLEELRLLQSHIIPRDVSRTLCIWNRFNVLIEQQFKTEHNVSYYASELGVTTRKLGEIVKLYAGRYVSDVIDERLMTEAKRMILFSDFTLKEIAFELGFEEHSYFSKVFKRLTGKTPSEFRLHDSSVSA